MNIKQTRINYAENSKVSRGFLSDKMPRFERANRKKSRTETASVYESLRKHFVIYLPDKNFPTR